MCERLLPLAKDPFHNLLQQAGIERKIPRVSNNGPALSTLGINKINKRTINIPLHVIIYSRGRNKGRINREVKRLRFKA